MKGATIFCVLVMLVVFLEEIQGEQHQGEKCGKEHCHAGQRCVENSRGHQECACRSSCPDHEHFVCASDGRTFLNHCELHRAACVESRRLRVAHDGACNNAPVEPVELKQQLSELGKEEKDEEKSEKDKRGGSGARPLVCYQVERDELRQLIVESLYQKSRKEGRSFSLIQQERFESCDKNGDGYVDSDELLTCLEKAGANEGNEEHVHRGLCVDALLTEGAHDDNWMLDSHEFSRLFHPHFRPRTRECELEEKKYKDGSETKVDCNWCVCACGDWVCTGGQCPDGKQDSAPPETPVREGRLPTVAERQELLRGFADSAEISITSVQRTVAEQYGREQDLQELLNLE